MDLRLEKIKEADNYLLNTINDFKGYLKDTCICLEDRWNAFKRYSHHLDTPTDCPDYGPIELAQLHSCPERYKTYFFVDEMEYLEDVLTLDQKRTGEYTTTKYCMKALENIDIKLTDDMSIDEWNLKINEFINTVKEDILLKGYQGFVFDW